MDYKKPTRIAYVVTRLLDTPFWALYNMLPVILYKELHATPLQLAAMMALRPLVSLGSVYWSAAVNKRPDRLLSNIFLARLLGFTPFFFFPFIENIWFFIFSFALYMMLAVGIVPAWMEILKINIRDQSREKIFAYAQAFGYMGGGLIPFLLGWLLDGNSTLWRYLFPFLAFISLTAFLFQRKISIPPEKLREKLEAAPLPKEEIWLAKPWRRALTLLRQNLAFRQFQIGSMAVGTALMIMQPGLPIFLIDALKLSYSELAIAITLVKGIGFALASPFWAKAIHQMNLFYLNAAIAAIGTLFPLSLFLAYEGNLWLYFGYLCYGIMQCGNELMWNMSGPLFAKNEDSSTYTSVNVMAIGLRGCIVPILGSLICTYFGASTLIIGAACLFAISSWLFTNLRSKTLAGATKI
jgi:MFS family permease